MLVIYNNFLWIEIFSLELLAHDEWFLQKLTSIFSTFEVEYGEKSRV